MPPKRSTVSTRITDPKSLKKREVTQNVNFRRNEQGKLISKSSRSAVSSVAQRSTQPGDPQFDSHPKEADFDTMDGLGDDDMDGLVNDNHPV
jgi:hypothetical protein